MSGNEQRHAAPVPDARGQTDATDQGLTGRSAHMAMDGEEIRVVSNGDQWVVVWHPAVPQGQPHGANALCVTNDGGVILISVDGERWGWPGGRPEGDESWEATLRREVTEEACASALNAFLLGYSRARCLTGSDEGLVLVRSIWRAEVELHPWQPRFEIPFRCVVPREALRAHLWMEPGFEPIYERAIHEARLF